MNDPIRLAVLVSGSGTTLQNLIDRIAAGQLHAQIACVIASRADAYGLVRAKNASLPHYVGDVFEHCQKHGADLVCLAGWLSLLEIPGSYRGRVMNIHPALLPSFGGRGFYGKRVHQAVIDRGCKVSGCTVHFVDEHYDNGPIILQRTCPVLEGDDAATLAHRVFEEEKIAYPAAIGLFSQGKLHIEGRRVRVG